MPLLHIVFSSTEADWALALLCLALKVARFVCSTKLFYPREGIHFIIIVNDSNVAYISGTSVGHFRMIGW